MGSCAEQLVTLGENDAKNGRVGRVEELLAWRAGACGGEQAGSPMGGGGEGARDLAYGPGWLLTEAERVSRKRSVPCT
jgi:hypothetical protein